VTGFPVSGNILENEVTRLLMCNWTANVGTGVTRQEPKLGMPYYETRQYLSFPYIDSTKDRDITF
jgi:hypothetical protein